MCLAVMELPNSSKIKNLQSLKGKDIDSTKLSSSEDINAFLYKLLPENVFLGSSARNTIPISHFFENEYSILIVNLDKQSEPGSHVLVIIKYKNELFLFDSFGLNFHYQIIEPYLEKKVKQLGMKVWKNTKQFQSDKSNVCGFFCVWFSLFFDIHRPQISNIDILLKHFVNPTKSYANERKILSNLYNFLDHYILCKKQELLTCLC